jgi:hypothetical protein
MAITFRMLSKVLPMVTATKKPVLLRARHGVGKSACVYAFAKHLGLPVVERRASQMTEGDLLGLPKLDENSTDWMPPKWYKKSCDEAVVLFIDELDRATMEVRQGFFELCDSRKISGRMLHPDTLIFSAINGGDDAAQYQVGEMDPAELDRWTVFDVDPDVEDWLNWASENCHKVVWDFINQNHNHLEHRDVFEPNKVYPSRRSWHRFSEVVELHESVLVRAGEFVPELAQISQAFLGLEASVAFTDFVKNMERQVTVEDLLVNGKFKLVEDFSLNDHTAMVEKIKVSGLITGEMPAKQLNNLAKYFNMLPSEAAMLLFKSFHEGNEGSADIILKIYSKIKTKVIQLLATDEEDTDSK